MYLSGSKWHMRKKRRRSNPLRVLFLLILVAGAVYLWRVYVPEAQPLFVPTPTVTRSPASYALEAQSLFEAGKLAQARKSYEGAIAVDPRQVSYYVELARLLVFAGEFAEAETAARDALVIDPGSALAHALLGWALDFQASQTEDAAERQELLLESLQKVERAYELNPNLARVLAFYAEVLIDYDIDRYLEARDLAERAVALDNTILETHRALGYVWEVTGNPELALESYERARAINPNLPRLHIDVGNMQRAIGDVRAAIDTYLKAVALAPSSTEPLTLIANALARIGEFGEASQYAKQAVDLNPSSASLRGNLGRMYYHNSVFNEAIYQLELAIRGGSSEEGVYVDGLPLDPGKASVVEFYYTYGLALAKQNRCEEAVPIFEALLRGVPEDEIAVFNAQEGLILCGQLERTPTPEAEGTPSS